MKTKLLYLFLAMAVFSTQACDSINELSGGADTPEATYPSTSITATFYQAGESSIPTIDWNGAQGTVSLGSSIEGLSINSTTGQLQWTKMLPPGTHDVQVVLSNSEGQVVVPVTIENPVVGKFEGTYGGGFYDFNLELLADETLLLTTGDLTATGTYEIVAGAFSAYYDYNEPSASDYSLRGELQQTSSSATITGYYYAGVYEPGMDYEGDFEVSLE